MTGPRLWDVQVLAGRSTTYLWCDFADDPTSAATAALARWAAAVAAAGGARAEVRELGSKRQSPVYVGWA